MVSLAAAMAVPFIVVILSCSISTLLYAQAFVPPPTYYSLNFDSKSRASGVQYWRRHGHNKYLPRAKSLSLSLCDTKKDEHVDVPDVLCVGETLWDSLPSGMFLGGAPSNVAVHLASLGTNVAITACLGNDQLGKEAQRRLSLKGVNTDYIQYHSDWETGIATANIDENGDATYIFNTPAAWDGLNLEGKIQTLLVELNADTEQQSTIFVLGTIAGRLEHDHGATSFSALMTIRNEAPEGSVVLDVNLRPPFYTPERVLGLARGQAVEGEGKAQKKQNSRQLALLKLNEDELGMLEQWCGLKDDDAAIVDGLTGSALQQRMDQLATSLNTQRVCVTRGQDGAALLCKDGNSDQFYEKSGFTSSINNDSDTVGAGDAFLASLVNSLFIQKELPQTALAKACALGGYVAGCRGATPDHSEAPDELRSIFS